MRRESYWDYMGRRLREDQLMSDSHPWLHMRLEDQEKKKIADVYDEVTILKKEVAQLQESLQNSYLRIKELKAQVDYYEKLNEHQLEFEF